MSRRSPIVLRQWEVEAILEGRKTQMRRVIKGQDSWGKFVFGVRQLDKGMFRMEGKERIPEWLGNDKTFVDVQCPYGQPGDTLWVKEPWACLRLERDWESGLADGIHESDRTDLAKEQRRSFNPNHVFAYPTDNFEKHPEDRGFKWRSPVSMPFDAARLLLRIRNLRVERLQTIGRQDALREGIQDRVELEDTVHEENYYQYKFGGERYQRAVDAFSALWQSVNGSESWSSNPWVWVLDFEVDRDL